MALPILCILAVNMVGLIRLTEAVTEGGPSGFGYDASSACSKPYSRTGRARLDNLPCDFSRENWCTIAGNAYPWQAVRRFVHENQGLMRRMYGDEKHISILKTELEKNDVELELEDESNHLYAEESNSMFRQFQFDMEYEFEEDSPAEDSSFDNRRKLARALNSGAWSKFEKSEDHRVHPNETPTGVPASSTSTTNSASTLTQASISTSTAATSTTVKTHRTKMTPIASTASTAPSAPTAPTAPTAAAASTPSTASTAPSPSTSSPVPPASLSTTVSSSTSSEPASLANIVKIQNLSINEIPGQIDRFDSNIDEHTEIPETTLSAANEEFNLDLIAATSDEGADFEEPEEPGEPETSETQHKHQQQQFRPRPEYRPAEVAKPESTTSPEAQLYQDVAAKDKQEAPVLKVRGINACPVKEEVVAPFWANNTRGEVLALLNLYPFEQYVHWEKCTHENKQMYCRDGCRCEQQYRLHRLLAYDPNNECRGIFSDWFKFPSCCICRCYDLPIEFRVTSRSPRIVRRQKIKVRAPRRHRAARQRHN